MARSIVLRVRVTPTEKAALLELAAEAGLELSEYVRTRALGDRVEADGDGRIAEGVRRRGAKLVVR